MKPDLSLAALRAGYLAGTLDPARLIAQVLDRCDADPDPAIWISRLDSDHLQAYLQRLEVSSPASLPLYGVPFAIKDNIDLAGAPTTAGCPDFAYRPEHSAFVVELLIAAGAIPIGKTNMDQFATGLNGTRSPYGAVRNSFDPAYIAGGSSAGSAVAVAKGLVSFALGTDTAGSGRVPAALNNLIGVKPTRGALSTRGVVPACRSLDCVSVFALSVGDAACLFDVLAVHDRNDSYARPLCSVAAPPRRVLGVPAREHWQFFGNGDFERAFTAALDRYAARGYDLCEIDFAPFRRAAELLYQGPWVAERYVALAAFLRDHASAVHPVVRGVIEQGHQYSACDVFTASYALADYKRDADRQLAGVDAIVTPTVGTSWRITQMLANPIELNSHLGYYTNFMNLLDYAALAIPAGFAGPQQPFGVTLFAPAFHDRQLLAIAHELSADRAVDPDVPVAVATGHVSLAVCGAHMSGLPLSQQLIDLGASLECAASTAPCYRLYALPGGPPARPGLVRVIDGGAAIDLEVWRLPVNRFGEFIDRVRAPLAIGNIELSNGRWVKGFVCESWGIDAAREITAFGGWRRFLGAQ